MLSNFNDAENFVGSTAKMAVGIGAVDMVFGNMLSGGSLAKRSLQRGALFYLANETVEDITTGTSNFRKMDTAQGWKNLVDDTVWFGLVAAGLEQTSLLATPINVLERAGVPENAASYLSAAVVLNGVKRFEHLVEDTVVRKITNLLG